MRPFPLVAIFTATFLSLAGTVFSPPGGRPGPGPMGFRDPAPTPNDPSFIQCTSRLDGTSLVRQCTSPSATLLLITTPDGRSTLSAKVNGQQVFDGPYTTPEERAKVPKEISLQLRLGIIREITDIPSGDEWKVMCQKIQRVLEIQDLLAEAAPADMLAYSRQVPPLAPAPPAPPALANPANQLALRLQDLAKALDPQTPDANRKTLYTAVRDARNKLLDQLQTARKDLQAVSTVRHEAVFIHLGILE